MKTKVVATHSRIVIEFSKSYEIKEEFQRDLSYKRINCRKNNPYIFNSKFRFTDHAQIRCFERGINANEVIKVLLEVNLSNHRNQNILFYPSYLKRFGIRIHKSYCLLVSTDKNVIKTCIKIHINEVRSSIINAVYK